LQRPCGGDLRGRHLVALAGETVSQPREGAMTAAFGINVPKALGDFLVLEAIKATGPDTVTVDVTTVGRDGRSRNRVRSVIRLRS
jgi:hypothetical protein